MKAYSRTYNDFELAEAAYWCTITADMIREVCKSGRHTGRCRPEFFIWVYERSVDAMQISINSGKSNLTPLELECAHMLIAELAL